MTALEESLLSEAGDETKPILDAYDPAEDAFHFSGEGPFWSALKRAHQLGGRGKGHKVAIVDTVFDLDLPFLTRHTDRRPDQPQPIPLDQRALKHGTAVALLISSVAPDCRFDLYSTIGPDGNLSLNLVAEALSQAAASDADVINISLGRQRFILDDAIMPYSLMMQPSHEWLDAVRKDEPDCALCAAARKAIAAGKLLFAAAGNTPDTIWCPARAEGVISVGFQSSKRKIIPLSGSLSFETAEATDALDEKGKPYVTPTFDIAIGELEGVKGTSFASPLYAGVGALGISAKDLNGYIASIRFGTVAMGLHASLGTEDNDPKIVNYVGRFYERCLKALPHVHCSAQKQLRPDIPYSDPSICWQCGFFAASTYVNAGLFSLESHNVDMALDLLAAARKIAPWSPDAAANMGRAYEEKGPEYWLEAIALYDAALSLRPDFSPYLSERERISQLLHSPKRQ